MPLTHFPNGVSVSSTTANISSAASAGHLNADKIFLTSGGTAGDNFVGQRVALSGTFSSAAGTTYLAVPFDGQIVDVITTADTTPRTCSAFTLRAGSAGTVGVASVSLAFATAVGQQVSPTLTAFSITTASALRVTVTTAGTACNFSYTVILEKTA